MDAAQVTTGVLVVGAGPVGLTLAIDLAQRGVAVMLVEKNATSIQLPKMERCNARTMEIFRRLGIADAVRAAGLPRDVPMDVFLAPSMAGDALVHLPYPSVAAAQATIAANNDGRPLEPYQLISQYTLEPLLRSIADMYPNLDVRFALEMTRFEQDADGVTAELRTGDGATTTVRAAYIVGCDGGASTVRKQLGIALSGQGSIRTLRQALFHSDDLFERIPMGKGRHYHIAAPPIFPFIIIQDSTKHWTLHAAAESDEAMTAIFGDALGMDVAFETLSVNAWTQHLLCADRYRDGRAFIAGDAAHLVIPTGGLGMNTGVGDATDLAWKLAATLAGWGGPALLDSYEIERRQIGLRNVAASGNAMSGRNTWRAASSLADMAARFDAEQRKVTEILGIEAGYRYVASPIVCEEPGTGPDPNNNAYVPTTWPGFRLPHVWLEDGTPIHDRLGAGFTLLEVGAGTQNVSAFIDAFAAAGTPLDVQHIASPVAREIYGAELILVRPDLHVVWRGTAMPGDVARITATVTGNAALVRS